MSKRERVISTSTQMLMSAIDFPLAVAIYLWVGWSAVVACIVWFVVAAFANIGWYVWREVRA